MTRFPLSRTAPPSRSVRSQAVPRRASTFSRVVRLGAVLGLMSVLLVFGRSELALAQTSESGSDNARALPDKGFELDTARWQAGDLWSDGTTM